MRGFKADGYGWEVRFIEILNCRRRQRCQSFESDQFPTELSIRKVIELTVSQNNARTAGERLQMERDPGQSKQVDGGAPDSVASVSECPSKNA